MTNKWYKHGTINFEFISHYLLSENNQCTGAVPLPFHFEKIDINLFLPIYFYFACY